MTGLGNLQDPGLLDDPYPTYRRLLAEGPTIWDETRRMWLETGHAEVLRLPDTSVATAAARICPALGPDAARFERLITAISQAADPNAPPRRTPNFSLRGFTSLPVIYGDQP